MSDDPLRDRFEGVDRDANGFIDERELGQMLDALGVGYSGAQVHATFESIDTDHNGQIALEELRAWWTSR